MKVAIIGKGAIAGFVKAHLVDAGHQAGAVLVRTEHEGVDPSYVCRAADLSADTEVVVDCAGHAGLAAHGAAVLERGLPLITLSLGALADTALYDALTEAAIAGRSKLHLASGAIGALDCLQAARIGRLDQVTYTGRKPPKGWAGSVAEDQFDLNTLTKPTVHFEGTARDAALAYPKNANVAAAVALAGLGFDHTHARLVADPAADGNTHEVTAKGDFGQFHFQLTGKALPDNPRSSALAAMSVLSKLAHLSDPVTL